VALEGDNTSAIVNAQGRASAVRDAVSTRRRTEETIAAELERAEEDERQNSGRARMTTLANEAATALALDPVRLASRLGYVLDRWQVAILRNPAPQQLLCTSRQAGKTLTCALAALHQSLYVPNSVTLVTAPAQRQAAELLRKVRSLLSELAEHAEEVVQESVLSLEFGNESRILALPGAEGTIRGFTADLVLVDEAARIDDDLLAAVRPMLAISRGRLVLLSSPFGRRGAFFEAWENGGGAWERTRITAYEVPRIDPAWLEEQRRQMLPLQFQSEFLAEFVDVETGVFDYDLVTRAISADVAPLFPNGRAA
jgi:hypothetical protein